MDRLVKIFRSRFFLAALGIILEFVELIAVFTLLYEYFLPITVLGWIFHIGVLHSFFAAGSWRVYIHAAIQQ